jgi:hypothetical protein
LKKSPRHERSWTLRLKGVSGEIWARGALPADVSEWMDVDIIHRDGRWEASAAVAIKSRRGGGNQALTIRFDLLDGFAEIDGTLETPDALVRAQALNDRLDVMKSEAAIKWPRGRRYPEQEWAERCEAVAEIGRMSSYVARIRRDALHVWTARVVSRAGMLTVVKPAVKQLTKSPRGNEHTWGAEVEIVSSVNRNTLSYAPAMAVQMLEYKAKEAGIRCDIVIDDVPKIAVGSLMAAAAKTTRRIGRNIRRSENGE